MKVEDPQNFNSLDVFNNIEDFSKKLLKTNSKPNINP